MSLAEQTESRAPLRPVKLGQWTARVRREPDGTMYMTVAEPLPAYPTTWLDSLERWAAEAPHRIFLAQRATDGAWQSLTYAETLREVRRIGAALLTRGLSAERPIAVLSGNSIEHALLGLGAMYVGIPYAPVSPAYSLMSGDFGKLRTILGLLTPGMVFASDGAAFDRAIEAAAPVNAELVVVRNAPASRSATAFSDLGADDTTAADAAHKKVGADDIAKFLFTSGSTGTPKGVINTHRMLSSNQAMLAAGFAFVTEEPPVVIDWLPWSHTFGSNHNFGMVLTNGGSLYIDDGNPTPAGVAKTVRNLRDVSPTVYFNVPKGYEALIPHLAADRALRDTFFKRLKVLFYAGAGLNQECRSALDRLAVETTGERIVFLSSLGSTETAPLALACTFDVERPGNIGVPAPGVELKLVPSGGKLEARLRGPHITPGYWRQPDITRDSFDDEGFYKIGDALKFADPNQPGRGLLFDGRLAEDFKLSTGTWVSVGPLRARVIDHFAPYLRDVVVAGADRDDIAMLAFPDLDACRAFCAIAADAPPLDHPKLRAHLAALLRTLAAQSPGSSTRVCRMLLLETPPSLDAGEMTDKGSINQRAVLASRAALVDELYALPQSSRIIGID
jgi:feruloyl-CoA synthase